MLTTPIALTNTHSVGVVRDALVAASEPERGSDAPLWSLPVVGETWDGYLNDIDGQHVTAEHVRGPWAAAAGGPVAEGNVGGGTGMKAIGFKAGIGTARASCRGRMAAHRGRPGAGQPRAAPSAGGRRRAGRATRSARRRSRCPGTAAGPPGARLDHRGGGHRRAAAAPPVPAPRAACPRWASGARGGGGEHEQRRPGDRVRHRQPRPARREEDQEARLTRAARCCNDRHIDALFWAAIEATEEAIVNALVAAETMTGRDGITFHALPHDRLRAGDGPIRARRLGRLEVHRSPDRAERRPGTGG